MIPSKCQNPDCDKRTRKPYCSRVCKRADDRTSEEKGADQW